MSGNLNKSIMSKIYGDCVLTAVVPKCLYTHLQFVYILLYMCEADYSIVLGASAPSEVEGLPCLRRLESNISACEGAVPFTPPGAACSTAGLPVALPVKTALIAS